MALRKDEKRPARVALTIAGSDPSGGAGLQADLKTFHQHGVYGCSAVTLLTVQNTVGVSLVQCLSADLVEAQIDAVCADLSPAVLKTGALGESHIVEAVAENLKRRAIPAVIDPVMLSKHGHLLMDENAIELLISKLLPQAYLVTPNALEAERLSGIAVRDRGTMERAAEKISELGPRNVLIKGSHADGEACDLLRSGDGRMQLFCTPHIPTQNTHGSGCVYSAAITARLARGEELHSAVEKAKQFIWRAIQSGPRLGQGLGPVNMHAECDRN